MPRRGKFVRHSITPDTKFQNLDVSRMIGRLMWDGKRRLAERILYDAFTIIEERTQSTNDERLKKPALEVFELALRNTMPTLEVKPRRVGGATYQVPIEVRQERRNALGMRWIIAAARARKGKPIAECLALELLDAAVQQGGAYRKREETHKMAESNKAFAHYRR